jgi:hypothetical protein
MKLRIHGNSLRLRITRPELDRLMNEGRIEESIRLGPGDHSSLVYALEHSATTSAPTVRFAGSSLEVLIPTAQAQQWSLGEDAGIYASVELGANGALELIIEKDFACLHGSEEENRDAFPNPYTSA